MDMWATMDQRYVILSLQFQFTLKLFNTSGSVNEILAFTQNICFTQKNDAQKRLCTEILALQKIYGYFTPSSIQFTVRKNC